MKSRVRIFVAAAVVALLGLGGWLWATAGQEATDDAQVDAHVTPVAARVGGTVLSVPIVENRFQLKRTSSTSTARPLTGAMGWNFTPGRILNVRVRRSGDVSQDCAMSPSTSSLAAFPMPGLNPTRRPRTVS